MVDLEGDRHIVFSACLTHDGAFGVIGQHGGQTSPCQRVAGYNEHPQAIHAFEPAEHGSASRTELCPRRASSLPGGVQPGNAMVRLLAGFITGIPLVMARRSSVQIRSAFR